MATVKEPVGGVWREPGQWLTLPGCKKVLVIVHTEVYGQRLGDLLSLLASDLRIQTVFTVAPHAFNGGATRFLRGIGADVLPWEEAVSTDFDLALAAGSQGMDQVRAPLIRLPHGAGHLKLSRVADAPAGVPRTVGGLGRAYLMRDGRVVPKVFVLAHRDELSELERWCPEALPVAEVAGDPCYDRISASLPLRDRYRRAQGLRAGEQLVLVSSTWGLGSSFNRLDALLPRLLAELPRRTYRVAVLVHPNVWAGHGNWQVQAWLSACRRRGVAVIPPWADWRAALIAADWIIGDHGSVTLYATLTRAPILMARFPEDDVNPASPGAALARVAPALSPSYPLREQFAYAASEYPAEAYAGIAQRISSEPGHFNRNMRRLMYRVLGLGQPAHFPETDPVPLPDRLDRQRWFGLSEMLV